MRISVKIQGIDKWINGWSCWTDFRRGNINCGIKWKYLNKDNNSNHFTISVFFVNYKRGEVEIRHVPSWYDKEQLPSLTYTQLSFFDEVHIQQVSVPPTKSKLNKHNIQFTSDEEGNIDIKSGKFGTNNQQKKANFKYEQEGIFFLGVANIKSKEGAVTGKWCPVYDYTRKILTIDAYQK